MNLEITIAGHSVIWKSLGAGRVVRWLTKHPWLCFHEPVVIQIPSQHEDEFLAFLNGEVRRLASGDVHVVSLRPTESVGRTFSQWLDLGELSTRKLAESLVDCARRCPRLFVIGPVAHAAIWTDELRILLDTAQKLPDSVPFGVVLTSAGPGLPPLSVPCDAGWPELQHLERDENVAWATYLHERIAWHVAGNLDRVAAMTLRVEAIRLGRDRELEEALGRDADEGLAMFEKSVQDDLLMSIRNLSRYPNAIIPQGLSGRVSTVPRPAPWLARALLRANPTHPERRYLAALTVCRPLADRLLGRCVDLEQRCRDRLMISEQVEDPDDEARHLYERHKAKQSDEHIYSPGEPPEALDAWEFMDFARVIDACQSDRIDRNNMHELRRIRNLLAHGKSIGWKVTTTMDRLERVLSTFAR